MTSPEHFEESLPLDRKVPKTTRPVSCPKLSKTVGCLANRSSQSLGAAAQDDSMSFDGGIESSESNALSLSLASPGPETPFRSSNSP